MARPTDVERTIKRTTVDLDVDDLHAAREALGTETAKDTINAALRDVARRAALTRAAALILEGGLEIVDPDDLAALRQSRSTNA